MKKLIVLAISLAFLSSCGGESWLGEKNPISKEDIQGGYQIVEIDGCEYIYYSETRGYSGYGFLSHKGNCKNPIHSKKIETVYDTVEYKLVKIK